MNAYCTNCDAEFEDIMERCLVCGSLFSIVHTPEYRDLELDLIDFEAEVPDDRDCGGES